MRKSIAVLFLSCLFSAPVFSQNYYVCNNGTDSVTLNAEGIQQGTTPELPWATYDYAIAKFRTIAAGDSVLFCRGGTFTSSHLGISNMNCTAASPCTLGDYLPAGLTEDAALPIINGSTLGAINFQDGGNADHDEGYVVKNLNIKGTGGAGYGFFIYNDVDYLTIDNVTIDGFNVGIYSAKGNVPNAGADQKNDFLTIKNSTIINNPGQGFLGGGENFIIENNKFINNGFGEKIRNHNIYITQGSGRIDGNELYQSALIAGKCEGVSLVVHGVVDGLSIKNNWIHEDLGAAAPTCWGLSVDPGYTTEESFNNVTIADNRIENVGNRSIGCASCTNTWIIGNTITHEQDFGATAIVVPVRAEDSVKSAKVLIGGNDITLVDPNRRGKSAVLAPATDEFYQIGNAVH
jgi:hypothetical protein